MTIWDELLQLLRPKMPEEDFRRWFAETAYASDSGDQITVWVPTEAIRRHIVQRYDDDVRRALESLGRAHTHVRFIAAGTDEDVEDVEE